MKLTKKIESAIKKRYDQRAKDLIKKIKARESLDCAACDDDELWIDVPESERRAICGPQGLNCPGWGGDPQG